jgi:hypothetical protein
VCGSNVRQCVAAPYICVGVGQCICVRACNCTYVRVISSTCVCSSTHACACSRAGYACVRVCSGTIVRARVQYIKVHLCVLIRAKNLRARVSAQRRKPWRRGGEGPLSCCGGRCVVLTSVCARARACLRENERDGTARGAKVRGREGGRGGARNRERVNCRPRPRPALRQTNASSSHACGVVEGVQCLAQKLEKT